MPTPPDPRWIDADGNSIDEEDRGLVYDMRTLIDRRRALGLFGGFTAAALLMACNSSSGTASSGTASTGTSSGTANTAAAELTEVPEETGGPYPGDGSNGPNVLDDCGIVRNDIRSSFGSSTNTAQGLPLTVALTIRDASSGDAVSGAAVYLWHCDRDGNYSLYSPDVTGENYLRGVQQVDAGGTVTFTSIYPACYSGRWPHIHFEIYDSLDNAIASGPIVRTSQIALPKETCQAVYATSGYEQSMTNLGQVSLSTDMVFRDDGAIHQLATMSGDATQGYTAALTVGV
jgi:protocatechuate 3,4-dioxygenase beta subunit